MKAENRKALVHQIMGLNAPVTATGASAAGYFGIMSNRGQAVLDLKRITAEFADEHQKAEPDQAKIKDLTGQIEAGLRTLRALNILDQPKLDSLLQTLHP